MRAKQAHWQLVLIFTVLMLGYLAHVFYFKQERPLDCLAEMVQAKETAQKWMEFITRQKQIRGIRSDIRSLVPNRALLGDDWSAITTTLGSLQAKELSTNPDFAALVVRWLHEAGLKPGDKAAVMLSGSFPALAIATFAALKTMHIQATIAASLGASTYGANQPLATWLDYATWLQKSGDFPFHADLVTAGGEGDTGTCALDEGREVLQAAALRNGSPLIYSASLQAAQQKRLRLFNRIKPDIVINIGGGQAALGTCAHAPIIPNGLHATPPRCQHPNRGVLQRLAESGIPYIHFLNIKELAGSYGIPLEPGPTYGAAGNLYTQEVHSRIFLWMILFVSVVLCLINGNNRKRQFIE